MRGALTMGLAAAATAGAQELPTFGPPVTMEPFIVTAPKPHQTPLTGFLATINEAIGKKFMDMRGGPLLDAIWYRYSYLRDHPGEKAIVVVATEPVYGRVTAAATVVTEDGNLYASSQALGNKMKIKGFTAADIDQPEKVADYLNSMRQRYLEIFDNDIRNHTQANAKGLQVLGAMMAEVEESGDYSLLGTTHRKLINQLKIFYEGDPDELMQVAYDLLHDYTAMPVDRSSVVFDSPQNNSKNGSKPSPTDVVVFDWDGVHYLYNPNLGTYGQKLPLNSVTGGPAMVVRKGDILEALCFLATFHKMFPQEKAAFLPALDGLHAAVAYTKGGALSVFSFTLGKFTLPQKYHIEDVEGLARLHAQLVTQKLAKGGRPDTGTIDELPGDTADLQVRRACLELRDAGFQCETGVVKEHAALRVTWPKGTYLYVAPTTN